MRAFPPTFGVLRVYLTLGLLLAFPTAANAQILATSSDSLTSYQYTGNTLVQGVRPQYLQRGATFDGAMRSRPAYPMALAGNPFENAWTDRESYGGIRIDLGAFAAQDVDIALPTDGIPWVIGRNYNARQLDSGSSAINSNGYQGRNWFQTSQPEIVFYDDATNTKDLIYLVYGADRYVQFVRAGTSSNQFKGSNGGAGCFNYVSSSPDTYVYTDQQGNEWTFFGFNTTSHTTDGQFWKVTTPNSKTSFVGDATTGSTAITNGYSGGKITTAYDASDRRFTYTYTTLNGTSRLTQVKAETKTGGTWASSPTGVATAVQVDYTYYADETHGDIGDLKQVKITTRLNDSAGETIEQVKRKHYRYWEGSADDAASYNSTTNPGYPHALKYVYDFEGVRLYDWNLADDHSFDEDHLSATDANLESYASAYFEYDSSHRVREAWFDGQCGCGGGSDGTFLYVYETNPSWENNPGYDQVWATRTVVHRPDGGFLTQYFDEVGQGLSQVISDIDPGTSSPTPATWVTKVTRSSIGCVTDISTPENVTAYTHNSGGSPSGAITVSTSAGLVRTFVRTGSGDFTGFATDWKHKLGTSGTAYFDGSQTFTSLSKTITDVTIVRPLIATKVVYSEEISTGSSGAYTTSYSYTSYSGASQPLAIEKITQTDPTVTTANNGSNSATTIERHYRKDELIDFQKSEDATIDYWEYSNGQVSKFIHDADTSKTGANEDFFGITPPSGFTKTGDPLHKKTETSYTSQGFVSQVTPPGNKDVTYRTRLADHRLVVIQYADYLSGPNFYGPARFSVINQAGKVEAGGLIAYTGNVTTSAQDDHIDETDYDPLLAVAVGSVAQMRTSVYSSTGSEVTESRVYFSIPGSGAGTEGTHYDATRFAYDDSGRRIRTKEPSGTIQRSTYDLFGRVTASSIGTNDNGLPGGEASGTSNMVTTETRELDSGTSGKNGNLTKIARYTTSSAHDDTTFLYDYRGRRIVELPPLAPFTLHKPDNMGREIATGQYSSSSGLDASDDPTSLATTRMALSKTYFDEGGQVWKSERRKIDDADGSDDDGLETQNWYTRRGLLAKTDGPELKKTKYDRLGRATDEYVLAKDNDTTYANVVDTSDVTAVDGDIVLEESQTRYDTTTGTVILEARIDRFHDDYSTGETTGALDTNADNLPLKLTFTNLEGRAQITAKWYDDLERLQDRVEYGTNGGSDFNRSGLSVPARSDSALRTSWAYNTDGTVTTITDPKALVTKRTYDAEGRVTKEVKNYVDGTPGTGADDDVTVVYEYSKGLRTKLKADLPSGETDQETIYIYGSTKDTPSQMKIATGHLLRATKYPDTTNSGTTVASIDSDASDVVSLAYDAQGREVYKKDQAGNIYETDYDANGRQTQRRVTTLASGFDSAIRRIATTYDSLGRTSEVVQYDNATVGSGTAKDGVKYTFDDWGPVATYAEDRDSAVTGGGNQYTTTYAWVKATTGRNALRKTDATLPGGRAIEYTYRTTGGLHDGATSRVTFVNDGATALARYYYNGVGQVVAQQCAEPDVMWNLYGSTGTYPDLDSFNRVVSSRWTKDLVSPGVDFDFYSVALTYDRNSNITSADDSVHSGFDVKYTMDNVNRLTQAEEGTLGGGTISSRKRDEQWTLTQTGNWELDKVDLNGDGDFVDASELNDDRTHNMVNELTARDTDDNGTDNYTLTYDAAGNMNDDGKDYEYEYDAFYRLRKVKNTSNQNLIAEYRYNGLGHRIAVHEDTDTDGDVDASDKWYYDAFDESWRHLARFRESDSTPKEDFVPHQAGLDGKGGSNYLNLEVCRNRDANTAWTSASDGNLEERLYYCQNWKAAVTAIVTSSGTMKEWAKYSAYGIPLGLPGGDTDSDGDCDSTDVTQVQTWIDAPAYDVRGDIDLDGNVDAADKSTIQNAFQGITLGRGSLTASGVGNRIGLAGYEHDPALASRYHVRLRMLSGALGRWIQRDPLDIAYFGGLAEYVSSSPVGLVDPSGAIPSAGGCKMRPDGYEACSFVLPTPTHLVIPGAEYDWILYSSAYASTPFRVHAANRHPSQPLGDCSSSQCEYDLRFHLQPRLFNGEDGWRAIVCEGPTDYPNSHQASILFRFWHGIHVDCSQAVVGLTTTAWPQWDVPSPHCMDGSSECTFAGTMGHPVFPALSLDCDGSNPDQDASGGGSTGGWVINAANNNARLGLSNISCWCSCGLKQNPN